MNIRYVATLVVLSLSIISCNKDDSNVPDITRSLSFGFINRTIDEARKASNEIPTSIRISIMNSNGEYVIIEELLSLFPFGETFVTESIELNVGAHELTLFQILNEEGAVIMASPIQGSEKAEEVERPLPISFEVTEQANDRLVPEVLLVGEDDSPSLFGYIAFGFELVDDFSINIGVISDYDSSYVPSEILIKSYSNDSSLLEEQIYSYESGSEIINGFHETVHFYEVSIDVQDFHSIKYFLETAYLKSLDELALRLSPLDFADKHTVYRPTEVFENEMNVYLPRDGCVSYVRFDLTGISSFYVHISNGAYEQISGLPLILPNLIESVLSHPSNVIFPNYDHVGSKAFNICDQIYTEYGDDIAFDVEVLIMSDSGTEFNVFAFTWDSATGLWTQEM